jgi:hypothetical protein
MAGRRSGGTPAQPLNRRLGAYSLPGLLTLATAAGSSPSVRHRLVSVSHLISRSLALSGHGAKTVTPELLPSFLDAARRDNPEIAGLEDYLPVDSRMPVVARRGDGLVRLCPGMADRPVAAVVRTDLVADAIDEFLLPQFGFGVRDYVDVGLSYADHAIRVMEPSWPDDDVTGLDSAPVIVDAEYEAAANLISIPLPSSLTISGRRAKALRFATLPASSVPYDVGSFDAPFGPFLAVALPKATWQGLPPRGAPTGYGSWWLPLGFIPTALQCGVDALAAVAAADDRSTARFMQLAADRARRALRRFGHLSGPPDLAGPAVSLDNVVQWVCMLTDSKAVLVQLMARLKADALPLDEEPAAVRLCRQARGSDHAIEVPMPLGVLTLDPRTEIVPLLVIATPGHVVAPQAPGRAAMSLDDLAWAAETADAQSDLFMFCRDLASPDRPPIFGWEAINLWETWRRNGKSFSRGAASVDRILIEPHQGDLEWWRASVLVPLEEALLAAGLPPASSFDGVEPTRGGPWRLDAWHKSPVRGSEIWRHPRPGYATWLMHLSGVPVAARVDRSMEPEDHARFLRGVASSLVSCLDQARATWEAVHADTGVSGYNIGIEPASADAPALAVREVTVPPGPVRASLLVNVEALAAAAAADIRAVPTALADAISDLIWQAGLAEDATRLIREAWEVHGTGIAVARVGEPGSHMRGKLTPPVPLDAAFVSAASKEIAARVRAAGVQVGIHSGAEAKALANDVLAPAALSLLRERLALYDVEALIRIGMAQAERAAAIRFRDIGSLVQTARLSPDWDVAAHTADVRSENSWIVKCIEVLVELALRDQPAGREALDAVAWSGLLAAAHAYLEATSRSEAVHHQVRPTAIEISELHEIDAVPDAEVTAASSGSAGTRVYDLDISAFHRARAEYDIAEAHTREGAREDTAAALADIPAPIDVALKESVGASGSDIINVLLGLASWAFSESDSGPVIADVNTVHQVLGGMPPVAGQPDAEDRIRSAVSLLTSRPENLSAADWRPWHASTRRYRLLAQPLAVLPDDSIVIAPCYCARSATVYDRYLTQGKLPWSEEPPPALRKALAAWREQRNSQLEKDVAFTLEALGFSCMTRISKPRQLGVPSLAGEVDVVAGRTGSPVIWLIEVKDPTDVFAVPEIRRHLDRFYVTRGKEKAYTEQLAAKYEDLRAHADVLAATLKLQAVTGVPYEIRPIFVTRRPVPAAFVNGHVPFVTLQDLASTLIALEQDGIGNQ